ncbi:MAG: hypothetical protein FP826_05620 [Sphingomonadales bacterium]|nr:hypothetical protein [Sphingomonadales bacterium]MBU3992419.1 hypothetical protein [Alphaproteobacteria bacterium]
MDMAGARASRLGAVAVFCGLLAATMLVRWQTLGDPVLGFDEQYYLLVGERMLHGAVPYVDLWDRKPIGLFLIYALAAAMGSDPFLQYKLLAGAFVAMTAFVIYRAALARASRFAAMTAALLYVLWLNFMEGEGGQSPVFYNLPVLLAALVTQAALGDRDRLLARGGLAMGLIGLALQIKYTAVFEGLFFGLALLWAKWRADGLGGSLIGHGLVWIACALAPTGLALAAFAARGQAEAFVFANFLSIFGRLPDPLGDQLGGLAAIVGILLLPAIPAVLAWRQERKLDFMRMWALAAVAGIAAIGNFLSPSYALPLLAPLFLCAAPYFDRARRGRIVAVGLVLLGLVAGQFVVAQVIRGKGNRAEALAVAAAARPTGGGCIWVYDGYPALYLLTGSCVPTKWAFPGHLNTANENSPQAIGVDPVTEVRRILATRPEAIVDDFPVYRLGNPDTRRIVAAELARNYRLVARVRTGGARYRLIYRRK